MDISNHRHAMKQKWHLKFKNGIYSAVLSIFVIALVDKYVVDYYMGLEPYHKVYWLIYPISVMVCFFVPSFLWNKIRFLLPLLFLAILYIGIHFPSCLEYERTSEGVGLTPNSHSFGLVCFNLEILFLVVFCTFLVIVLIKQLKKYHRTRGTKKIETE